MMVLFDSYPTPISDGSHPYRTSVLGDLTPLSSLSTHIHVHRHITKNKCLFKKKQEIKTAVYVFTTHPLKVIIQLPVCHFKARTWKVATAIRLCELFRVSGIGWVLVSVVKHFWSLHFWRENGVESILLWKSLESKTWWFASNGLITKNLFTALIFFPFTFFSLKWCCALGIQQPTPSLNGNTTWVKRRLWGSVQGWQGWWVTGGNWTEC